MAINSNPSARGELHASRVDQDHQQSEPASLHVTTLVCRVGACGGLRPLLGRVCGARGWVYAVSCMFVDCLVVVCLALSHVRASSWRGVSWS